MKWGELKERAKDEDSWTINATDALWEGDGVEAYLFIYVPINTLDPVRERIALLNEDIIFGCYFLNPDIMYDQVAQFAEAWNNLWEDMEEKPKILIEDSPPEDLNEPKSFEWTPKLLELFPKFQVSKTSLASLWGQYSDYFDDMDYELNIHPMQVEDPKIIYNQSWIERMFKCPFCGLTDPSYVYVHSLKEPEELYYDPNRVFMCMICPKCERFVEVVPRKNIMDKV